ncbi:flagellar hook-basal body complex protein FliE [Paucibacter sp. R3-3]|uniref:Flagellar hook-basal body complex protein FliE n=1 Tax=Roseateles agri TaxID=3098619 RepID=A0ABU5DMB9_9BURK|nr:flagellar hook-basal body complex protein FliE [Paucibacter sp. R3-3]MDY0747441.1 flagellar hook-basal body complex protein FliE [Paucibacter sp. R3-3]
MAIQQSLGRIDGDAAQLGGAVAPVAANGGAAASGGFAQSMQDALQRVDGKEHAAADRMAAVDSGQSDDLVGAMLSSQDASLSFSMLMQVRNKVMGAMDELIKLQL